MSDSPADSLRLAANRSVGRQIAGLVAFIAVCALAGWLGSLATTPNIPTWYADLAKPWFNPPNSIFPIVWTALYFLMAIAAWLVWRARDSAPGPRSASRSQWALFPFFFQLILNVAWSFAFFGAHNPFFGLLVIAILLAAIAWAIGAFWQVSRIAAALLVPYLGWVSFASLLNAAIYQLN